MTRLDYCPVAQEPCQAMCALSDVRCKIRDTPPAAQRQWVGLTDEELGDLWNAAVLKAAINGNALKHFARAIEAKLKEKNT